MSKKKKIKSLEKELEGVYEEIDDLYLRVAKLEAKPNFPFGIHPNTVKPHIVMPNYPNTPIPGIQVWSTVNSVLDTFFGKKTDTSNED